MIRLYLDAGLLEEKDSKVHKCFAVISIRQISQASCFLKVLDNKKLSASSIILVV
jgi:hypothetical protein